MSSFTTLPLPPNQSELTFLDQFSTEKPRPEIGLIPLPDEEFEKGKVEELSALANFRVRILPVLGPLPAMVCPLSLPLPGLERRAADSVLLVPVWKRRCGLRASEIGGVQNGDVVCQVSSIRHSSLSSRIQVDELFSFFR